jgi:branched-subunit amino acid permease
MLLFLFCSFTLAKISIIQVPDMIIPILKWMYHAQIPTVYPSVKEEMFQSLKEGYKY